MQSIAFVLLFFVRTISLAADVTIYNRFDYYNAKTGTERKSIVESQFPWEFSYHSDDWVSISIYWKNKSPSVTAMNVTYITDSGTFSANNGTASQGPRRGEEYYYVNSKELMKSTQIEIMLNLYKSYNSCSSISVAKGREVANISNETFQSDNILAKYGCVLVVDLLNQCDDHPLVSERNMSTTVTTEETIHPNTNTGTYNSSTNSEITTEKSSAIDPENADQQPSQNNMLIYVIPSVIGMCVIILVVYLLGVKKYCHRNSQPVEIMELNTYAIANEVVYADLSFVHGDSQPLRHDEESTYAQIIVVLKPTDGNVKK